jgi:hypothetical protein
MRHIKRQVTRKMTGYEVRGLHSSVQLIPCIPCDALGRLQLCCPVTRMKLMRNRPLSLSLLTMLDKGD